MPAADSTVDVVVVAIVHVDITLSRGCACIPVQRRGQSEADVQVPAAAAADVPCAHSQLREQRGGANGDLTALHTPAATAVGGVSVCVRGPSVAILSRVDLVAAPPLAPGCRCRFCCCRCCCRCRAGGHF